jgi:hypothetical protein
VVVMRVVLMMMMVVVLVLLVHCLQWEESVNITLYYKEFHISMEGQVPCNIYTILRLKITWLKWQVFVLDGSDTYL